MCRCNDRKNAAWNCLVWLCRAWGLITAVGLWGVGIEAAFYGYGLGAYFIVIAVMLSFFETVFLIDYWVVLCTSEVSPCLACWKKVQWLDDWRKGFMYLLLSVPCFLEPHKLWLAVVSGYGLQASEDGLWVNPSAERFLQILTNKQKLSLFYNTLAFSGVMMLISSILYMIKTFKSKKDKQQEGIEDNDETYGRFDEIQEDLEESIINPTSRIPIISVADQNEILQV